MSPTLIFDHNSLKKRSRSHEKYPKTLISAFEEDELVLRRMNTK